MANIQKEMNLPRFAGLSPSSQAASEAKRRTRGRDTRPELLLRRELWRRGYRYRIHARDLPGRPDLIFRGARVAVFCDGDFWHGRDWTERREKLQAGANGAYWIAKIESNMRRDLRTNELLREPDGRVPARRGPDVYAKTTSHARYSLRTIRTVDSNARYRYRPG